MAKPTSVPEWNSAGSNNTEPGSTQKASGWTVGQTGSSSYMNWWMKLVYAWVLYLNGLTAEANTWTNQNVFSEGVNAYQGSSGLDALTGQSSAQGGYGVRAVGAATLNNPGVTALLATGSAGGTATGNTAGRGGGYGINAQGGPGTSGAGTNAFTTGAGGHAITGVGGAGNQGGTGALLTGGAGAGATSAYGGNGVEARGGAGYLGNAGGVGGRFYPGAGQLDAIDAQGNIKLSGASPARTDIITNTLTVANVPKSWGLFTGSNGSSSMTGFNVASYAITSAYIDVVFAAPMATTGYAVMLNGSIGTASAPAAGIFCASLRTVNGFRIWVYDASGAAVNPSTYTAPGTTTLQISFSVFGLQ